MRWGIPKIKDGATICFAFLPVPLSGGGWAWLEWVKVRTITPRAFGVVGDLREFDAIDTPQERPCIIAATPSSPAPPKPKR